MGVPYISKVLMLKNKTDSQSTSRSGLRRFFSREFGANTTVHAEEDLRKHLKVLRLKGGDQFELFDGKGAVAQATLIDVKNFSIEVSEVVNWPAPPPCELIIVPPKGKNFDRVLRMATELGVTHFRLAKGQHGVVNYGQRDWEKNKPRFEKLIIEASRQSERTHVPELAQPMPLSEIVTQCSARCKVAFTLSATEPLPHTITAPVAAAIGPEGGFSESERDHFDMHGFEQATLGKTVLKVDTAAISGLSRIQARIVGT